MQLGNSDTHKGPKDQRCDGFLLRTGYHLGVLDLWSMEGDHSFNPNSNTVFPFSLRNGSYGPRLQNHLANIDAAQLSLGHCARAFGEDTEMCSKQDVF